MTKDALHRALVLSKSKLTAMREAFSETEASLEASRFRTECLTKLFNEHKEAEEVEVEYQKFLVREIFK